jgi:hypothetical protein
VDLPPNIGLTGNGLSGKIVSGGREVSHYRRAS